MVGRFRLNWPASRAETGLGLRQPKNRAPPARQTAARWAWALDIEHQVGTLRPAHISRVSRKNSPCCAPRTGDQHRGALTGSILFHARCVQVKSHGQQHALALPQARQGFHFARLRGQQLGGHAVQAQPHGPRGCLSDELLAESIGAYKLHHRQALHIAQAVELVGDALHHFHLRGRQHLWLQRDFQRGQQWRKPVIQVIQTLEIVDHPLVGAQGAGGQRLTRGLVDLQQLPVAQRAFGRQRIPGGIVQKGQRQGKGGVRTSGIILGTPHAGGQSAYPAPSLRTRAAPRARNAITQSAEPA